MNHTSRSHIYTHTAMNTHTAVMNYRVLSLKLSPVPHHMMRAYIILCSRSIPPRPFDMNTQEIERYVTYSITYLKSLTSSRDGKMAINILM